MSRRLSRLAISVTLAILAAVSCLRAGAGSLEPFLGLPPGDKPVVVRASFELQDINAIDDEEETFEFTGTLTLVWKDPRQAFNPAEAGVNEKIYQGNFQFDEISPAWYPQVHLVNRTGMCETTAVILRLQPDGTSTLVSTINAMAEVDFSMRRYPFDRQHLEAVFAIPGFDSGELAFEAQSASAVPGIQVSQWKIRGVEATARNDGSAAPRFVVAVDVDRQSMFTLRLVLMPLALIVALSWSVFWMERSSLGDRISVSFVGILTAVAYQIVVGDLLPHVSYVTLMHAILNFSLFLMCATVVVNLVVGACDRHGKSSLGDLIDHHCRWIFPIAYLFSISFAGAVAFLVF